MVKKPQVKNDIELAAQRLGTHLPKIKHPKLYAVGPGDPLQQVGLFNEFSACIEPYDFRTKKGTLYRPEPRVAGDVEHAFTFEAAALKFY